MPECATCESWITAHYQRVFGGSDGRVYACHSCSPNMVKRRDEPRPPKIGACHEDYVIAVGPNQ